MSYNPEFDRLLEDMRALHIRKGNDYARLENPYSNFEEAADEAGLTVHEVFDVMIGIKNARIRELRRSGKTPQNESLLDSYMDRLMYQALQLSYMRRSVGNPLSGEAGSYGHGV